MGLNMNAQIFSLEIDEKSKKEGSSTIESNSDSIRNEFEELEESLSSSTDRSIDDGQRMKQKGGKERKYKVVFSHAQSAVVVGIVVVVVFFFFFYFAAYFTNECTSF